VEQVIKEKNINGNAFGVGKKVYFVKLTFGQRLTSVNC